MELLVRIKDKPLSGDLLLDSLRTMRGDVIHVAPDGHQWGKKEIDNPEWRIIKCPDMGKAEAEALLAREPGDPLKNKYLRKRLFRLDLDALEKTLADQLVYDPNVAVATRGGIAKVEATRASLAAVKIAKEKIPDPDVIGPADDVVIG